MTAPAAIYTARDPGALSRALIFWLCADIVVSGLSAFVAFDDLRLVRLLDSARKLGMLDATPGANDLLVSTASVAQLGVFLATGFLSLKWIYRVSLNAHTLAQGMRVSPAWNVGWFFVPIAYLWKPFQGLSETWRVSASPATWTSAATPALLRWWWGLWLVGLFADNISFRLALEATTAGGRVQVDLVTILAALLAIPADLAFIFVVRRLCALQMNALRGSVFA